MGDGIEKPVEYESGGDQQGIALAFHNGFLVTEMLRGSTRLSLTRGPSLVLPVNVHQQKQAERNHGKEGFQ